MLRSTVQQRHIGEEVIELASVESTNKYAADRLQEGHIKHGTVILAHEQTTGIGRRGRSWTSRPGKDLTFSVVLRPRFLLVQQQFDLSKLVALAVRDAVVSLSVEQVEVKWPNDLLIDGMKIAGILIQNELHGDQIASSIVGIGVNVNSRAFPSELIATSVRRVTGEEHNIRDVLKRILEALDSRWSAWMAGENSWLDEYTNHLWARGRWVPFDLDDGTITARPLDVGAGGKLVVEMEDGSIKAFGMDRLRFVRGGQDLLG